MMHQSIHHGLLRLLLVAALIGAAPLTWAEDAGEAADPSATEETTVSGGEVQAQLERGQAAYLEADFEGSAEAFRVVLSQEEATDAARLEAHRYLAALALIFENQAQARSHVSEAVSLDNSATSPEGAPPELGVLFEEARAALQEQPTEEEEEEEEEEPEQDDDSEGFTSDWLTLGFGVGVYVPTLVNEMLPHVVAGLDVGLQLPFLDRRLSVVIDAAWSPPGADGEEQDPRLGQSGATWTYEMTTHEVLLSLGAVYRILPPGTAVVVPYVGLLARVTVLITTVDGSANGADFGKNTETSTQFGGTLFIGGEVPLGPGAFFFELAFGISDLPHMITGDTNTGALSFDVGYRLFL